MSLEGQLRKYIPEYDTAQVGKIKIVDLLLHQAGLRAAKAFYLQTLESLKPGLGITARTFSDEYALRMGKPSDRTNMNKHCIPSALYYRRQRSAEFPIPVAEGLFGRADLPDSMLYQVAHTPLKNAGLYRYSDWGFILLQRLVERTLRGRIDSLAAASFYVPLGMRHTGYNPWEKGLAGQCAPSENDIFFRKAVVQGYTHDMTAAMLGGIAGHAGLFSTASDLAVLGQMLLSGGIYGGLRYLNDTTVRIFTQPLQVNEFTPRGLGFDKISERSRSSTFVAPSVAMASYGHTGFTGTILWIDPEAEFVFVLLGNRTFPDSNNLKILSLRVRAQLMEVLYQAAKELER